MEYHEIVRNEIMIFIVENVEGFHVSEMIYPKISDIFPFVFHGSLLEKRVFP